MAANQNPIGWLTASGSPFDIGALMGALGKHAVHQYLIYSSVWARVTDLDHAETVAHLMANTQERFPEIHEEICGLAEGLGLALRDVYAWNCRGDILSSVPDGCTTVQTPGETIRIGHNEDGLPLFRGHCFILDANPSLAGGFRAFCYPGSIAGHTFGWNKAGLVQTVNNLRLQNVQATIPRMVLGRAVLSASTLQEASDLLSKDPRCGGFHMTLARAGESQLLSVEYGGGKVSIKEITARSVHTNHTLHLQHKGQVTTPSSQDRQNTGESLVRGADKADLDILRDTSGSGLPIRRDDPLDPDQENTLATCMFNVAKTGIEWRVFGEKEGQPAYQSENQRA